ncbi:PAS domain S-box-containing protein [Hymenobacter daecheongensis DSM 21074]|uniref:histidine kinase n=2 Tax=Hymenobacter daecheongensis TaxID=496053 RepID=A0A1M6EU06_9BACT|nr:PAS domain S-box-containing protein [Hymenobacter daecheongensis DSM 21074]
MPLASAFFEQDAAAVFALNQDGAFQRVNARFATLLGQPAAPLTGTGFVQCLPATEQTRAQQHLARALAGEAVCYEAGAAGAAASGVVFMLVPLVADGRVSGVYGTALPAAISPEHPADVMLDAIADVAFVLAVEAKGRYRFTFVNKAFEKATGLPGAKVVGSYVHDIIPEPSLSLVLDKYQQAVNTAERVSWLETSDCPAGRRVGEVSVMPLLDSAGKCSQLVGVVHNMTELKEGEEALRVSNERYQYALKATTDALYDWNIAADTLYWGEGFATLFGHQVVPNPGRFSTWASYVHDSEKKSVVDGLRHAAFQTQDAFWQHEYRFRRADGSWACVFDRGYILRDAQGQPVRMIGAMQDITERKEAEIRQSLMAAKLMDQNADLQQFAYIVSHNLRAPLANALGYADLLSRIDRHAEVFDNSLQNLHASLRQLDGILSDVNNILSARDKQTGYRPEPVAVAAVCRQALFGLEELLHECGGELHNEIPETLRLPGSRAYFHSIFHNLISNAIKYRSDSRPLLIRIQAVAGPGSGTTILFSDNGMGFDAEQFGQEIFQLYRRFHKHRPGRGIGLFLVKAHVESMGGQISVSSRVNEGTRFTLFFSAPNANLPD